MAAGLSRLGLVKGLTAGMWRASSTCTDLDLGRELRRVGDAWPEDIFLLCLSPAVSIHKKRGSRRQAAGARP
eukprot:4598565-Prymnesium_polylepis.1